MMTNGDHKGKIFLSRAHINNGLFFLLIDFFILKYGSILRCNIHDDVTLTKD